MWCILICEHIALVNTEHGGYVRWHWLPMFSHGNVFRVREIHDCLILFTVIYTADHLWRKHTKHQHCNGNVDLSVLDGLSMSWAYRRLDYFDHFVVDAYFDNPTQVVYQLLSCLAFTDKELFLVDIIYELETIKYCSSW